MNMMTNIAAGGASRGARLGAAKPKTA